MPNQSILSKRNIASFTLIFMSVQFMYFETAVISMPKVVYMCISPLLLLAISPKISKAIVLSILFWGITFALNQIQFENQRTSTFYYTAMFLSVFCLFYNLVWVEHCFSLDDFLKIIKFVIWAYAICLLLQQGAMLVGRGYVPIINLVGFKWQELFRLNSLAIEPSHAARVLTVYFYAFLKLSEFKNGYPVSLYGLFYNYHWLIFAFLYTMIAIGSGTAMVGLALISLYFVRRQYAMAIVIISVLFYFVAPSLDYDPLNRTINAFNAAITLDEQDIIDADRSASDRINLLLSFRYIDFSDQQILFGHGVDAFLFAKGNVVHGAIYDYGLISYLLKLFLYFSCALCGVFSLSTLMFFILFSGNIGNIAYGFACLMVFSAIKYFQLNAKQS